jgi:hypothetical protein
MPHLSKPWAYQDGQATTSYNNVREWLWVDVRSLESFKFQTNWLRCCLKNCCNKLESEMHCQKCGLRHTMNKNKLHLNINWVYFQAQSEIHTSVKKKGESNLKQQEGRWLSLRRHADHLSFLTDLDIVCYSRKAYGYAKRRNWNQAPMSEKGMVDSFRNFFYVFNLATISSLKLQRHSTPWSWFF